MSLIIAVLVVLLLVGLIGGIAYLDSKQVLNYGAVPISKSSLRAGQ